MASDHELRDAFGALADGPDAQADVTLAGLRSRMRRRRAARSGAVALPLLAAAGVAIAFIAGGTANPDNGQTVVADAVGTATPAEAAVADPTPTADIAMLPDEVLPVEPTPTLPEAATVPPSPTATPASTAAPTTTPPPVSPTTVPTQPPTSVPTQTQVFNVTGGSITVTFTSNRIIDVVIDPDAGYSYEEEKREAGELKINFSNGTRDVEVEIHLEDGQLSHQESVDDD